MKIPIATRLLYFAYRLFSICAAIRDYLKADLVARKRMTSLDATLPLERFIAKDSCAAHSIVIYAATIGELSGAKSFIKRITQEFPDDRLVILCGQDDYVAATTKLYPDAVVAIPPTAWTVSSFRKIVSPRMVCILEGPCLHGRFPILMDLTLVADCGAHRIPLFIIQASLHKLHPGGIIDRIEHRLFANLHKNAVTAWYPPSEDMADQLLRERSPVKRVIVTGDIKFSNIFEGEQSPPTSELADILSYYHETGAPIIVGGSVNSVDEVEAVLTGRKAVKQRYPDSRFILAPRHIHRPEAMMAIYEILAKSGYSYIRRSALQPGDLSADILVVDVFGELMYFYEISSICYIGRNHGVLEPLRFRKPVVVAADKYWSHTYVTYTQYKFMTSTGAIYRAESPEKIGYTFLRILEDTAFRNNLVTQAVRICTEQLGAVDRLIDNVVTQLHVGSRPDYLGEDRLNS